MPNWCVNRVLLHSDNARTEMVIDKVDECTSHFVETGDELPFLQFFFPLPKNSINEVRVNHWGTKWDILPRFPDQDNLRIIDFESAWAPPLEFLKFISADPEGIKTTIAFYEPGCNFFGVATDGTIEVEGDYSALLESLIEKDIPTIQSKFVDIFGLKPLLVLAESERDTWIS